MIDKELLKLGYSYTETFIAGDTDCIVFYKDEIIHREKINVFLYVDNSIEVDPIKRAMKIINQHLRQKKLERICK